MQSLSIYGRQASISEWDDYHLNTLASPTTLPTIIGAKNKLAPLQYTNPSPFLSATKNLEHLLENQSSDNKLVPPSQLHIQEAGLDMSMFTKHSECGEKDESAYSSSEESTPTNASPIRKNTVFIEFKKEDDEFMITPGNSRKRSGSMCITELWSKKEREIVAKAIMKDQKNDSRLKNRKFSIGLLSPIEPIAEKEELSTYPDEFSIKRRSLKQEHWPSMIEEETDENKVESIALVDDNHEHTKLPSLELINARYYLLSTMFPDKYKKDGVSLSDKILIVQKQKEFFNQYELKKSTEGKSEVSPKLSPTPKSKRDLIIRKIVVKTPRMSRKTSDDLTPESVTARRKGSLDMDIDCKLSPLLSHFKGTK